MSTDGNKAIVQRFLEEGYSKWNFDAWDEICVADLVLHQSPWPDRTSLEALKQGDSANRIAFPDGRLVIEDMIAEGDKVVARTTFSATHTGQWGELAPTGKHASTTGIMIFRLAEGKIVEAWYNVDFLGVHLQLGFELVPPKRESEV